MVSSGCEYEGCDLENPGQSTFVIEKILVEKRTPWERLSEAYKNILEKAGWTAESYTTEFITGNSIDISGTFQDPAVFVSVGGAASRYAINAGIKAAAPAVTTAAQAVAKRAMEACFVNPTCLRYLARYYPLIYAQRLAGKTDDFHNFPRYLDSLILRVGNIEAKSSTYAQFNAEGSFQTAKKLYTGVYELGVQLTDSTLYIAHRLFRPIK